MFSRKSGRSVRVAARVSAAVGVFAVAFGYSMSPASADGWGKCNLAFYGGQACYQGRYDAVGGGMVEVKPTVRVSRTFPFSPATQVCDYQAATIFQIPNGYAYYDYSSFHNGCSFAAWFDFPGVPGNYPKGTKTSGWWFDSETNGAFRKVANVGPLK